MRKQAPEAIPVTQPSNEVSIDTATLQLLANWQHQDAMEDPEEIRAAEQELSEFKNAMNENRALSGKCILYF